MILIPARAHSTGVPNKMLRLLGGKPVLHWTLDTALATGEQVVVTTPDAEILDIFVGGVVRVFWEPPSVEGQAPGVRTIDTVVQYIAKELDPHQWDDVLVVLQATTPFTSRSTIQACVNAVRGGAMSARTVVDDRHLRWEGSRLVTPRNPRQAMPPAWREHGACTALRWGQATQYGRVDPTSALVPVEGAETVDIDTETDWVVAEYYAAKIQREQLTAQVLADRPPLGATVVQLSAYEEPDSERLARQYVVDRLQPARVIRPYAAHTYSEAGEALSVVNDGEDVVIVTSAYHQPRAFLTFLRVLQETGRVSRVTLWNAPARTDFDPGDEAEKIAQYQAKGHVAQYHEGLTYLAQRSRSVVAV